MAAEVTLPKLSMTMREAKVVQWLAAQGDVVKKGQALVSVELDKATMDLEAPEAGVLSQILAPAETMVTVGDLLAVISTTDESAVEGVQASAQQPTVPRLTKAKEYVTERRRVSPVARKLAKEHGLDIDQIEGTGPGGAVVAADVRRLLEAQSIEAAPTAQPVTAAEISASGPETTILPLGSVQRSMRERMKSSHQTIVQATTVADVDMTEIARLRERIPASFTAFVIKAAAKAVAEFPLVNASLQEDFIVLKKHVHMGVAVATKDGLLVPVIRRAEGKTLAQVHRELKELSDRARSRTLKVEELSGPTMTVTNSGVFGSLLFTPIVVLPQSATLGMGRVAPTPVVREGRIVIRDIMYLCLSYDHRFLDGAVAVRYLQRVRAYLEDPISLLWDGEEQTKP